MKRGKLTFRDIEKIDLIGIAIVFILILLYVDFFDLNERYGFPINLMDEPLLILMGIILGYILGKFKVKRTLRKLI